jgi:hypothetical protein
MRAKVLRESIQIAPYGFIEALGRNLVQLRQVRIEHGLLPPNDVNQVSYGSSGDELFAPVFGCIGHAHGFSGLCFGGQPGRQPILRESKGSWMVRKAVVIWVAA